VAERAAGGEDESRGGAECRRRALVACGIVVGEIGERASWSGVSAQAVVA
jgi:hypothetical protein